MLVYVLRQGEIALSGKAADLLDHPDVCIKGCGALARTLSRIERREIGR